MTRLRFSTACLTLLLLGCASSKPSVMSHDIATPSQPQKAHLASAPQRKQYDSFNAWKQNFIQQAITQGIDKQLVTSIMGHVQFMPNIAKLDGKQPEFSKHIWSYLDGAVSDAAIKQGQKHFRQQRHLLARLEQRYDVPAEVVTAIWGLETAYGANTGRSNLPSALSTLAYDGRRRDFAENQLMALMRLVAIGDVTQNQLYGSWAGGMGQTQFIPTTYEAHAVDGNGDGRRNLWQTADALASTASYLSKSGWQANIPWGIEVTLPAQFRDEYVGRSQTWSVWQKLGVRAAGGGALPMQTKATLWLPGGRGGPALLTTSNFDVIKVYNKASSYALAVALLSDAIVGRPPLQAAWPRDALPLSRVQVERLQHRLHTLGYEIGKIDGILGATTRHAFQQWQHDQGIFADGFISQQTAQELIQ